MKSESGLKVLDSFDYTVDQILTKQLHDQGRTQREIAAELNISLGCVNKHLKNEQREHARHASDTEGQNMPYTVNSLDRQGIQPKA